MVPPISTAFTVSRRAPDFPFGAASAGSNPGYSQLSFLRWSQLAVSSCCCVPAAVPAAGQARLWTSCSCKGVALRMRFKGNLRGSRHGRLGPRYISQYSCTLQDCFIIIIAGHTEKLRGYVRVHTYAIHDEQDGEPIFLCLRRHWLPSQCRSPHHFCRVLISFAQERKICMLC